MLIAVVVAIVGLALLVKAADVFVDAAVVLAKALDVSPVVVGAIVVGFGTSAPELVVSGLAAAQGDRALGVGNVVGSNVANLSLVLAAAGFVAVIGATPTARRREAPLALLATGAFALVIIDGEITRIDGVALAFGLVVVLSIIVVAGRRDVTVQLDVLDPAEELDDEQTSVRGQLLRAAAGLALTVAGAQMVVWGAAQVADELDLSGGFIGFTFVALGTSLPELATAITAGRKGQSELVLGNLLGSNIFNSLAVGSVIGLVSPGAIGDDLLTGFGAIVMMIVTVGAIAFLMTGDGVGKVKAAVLLLVWVVAVAVLSAADEVDESAPVAPVTDIDRYG